MYDGGKNGAGTYQHIINKITPHTRYIELCLGSGAILNTKTPAYESHGIEIDPFVIDTFGHLYQPFAKIHNECLFKWCHKNRKLFTKETFVYVDPPYPMASRKGQRDIYEHEFTDQQHIDILKLVLSMPCNVAISTYKNPLYSKALSKWTLHTFQAQTRKGPATEYLYMNYPPPTVLHEYTYLGEDFTDRQRIKRKIQREVNKLKRLPVLERNAILDGIRSDIVNPGYTAATRNHR